MSLYVLRWCNPEPTDYYPHFEPKQKDAKRFDSGAAARAAVDPYTLVGADGFDDRVGWKVFRLVARKVRT